MLGKFIGRWVLMVIAVPLAAAGARRLSQAVESRRGSSRTSRMLRRSADLLQGARRRRTRFGRR